MPNFQLEYSIEVSQRNKREFRANRKRARRCNRGLPLQNATGTKAGKAQGMDDPEVRRPASNILHGLRGYGAEMLHLRRNQGPRINIHWSGAFCCCGPSPMDTGGFLCSEMKSPLLNRHCSQPRTGTPIRPFSINAWPHELLKTRSKIRLNALPLKFIRERFSILTDFTVMNTYQIQ